MKVLAACAWTSAHAKDRRTFNMREAVFVIDFFLTVRVLVFMIMLVVMRLLPLLCVTAVLLFAICRLFDMRLLVSL
jgi:hypothetical protein